MFVFPQIPHKFDKMFISKTLVWSISGLHFMRTIPSGSVKIIGKFITDTDIEKHGQ